MRYILLFASAFIFSQAYSQKKCVQNSILYKFYDIPPTEFTQPLGNHPEFEFLQKINGVTTVEKFIEAVYLPENKTKWGREFKAFDVLLRNSGFTNGYKDLSLKNVENVFVKAGTNGNLGFYDKEKDRISYIYVKLNPGNEDPQGIAAWKLTNKDGCYLYILHTCGNAWYPNEPGAPSVMVSRSHSKNSPPKNSGTDACKVVTVETITKPVEQKVDSVERPLHISIDFYQGDITPSKQKKNSFDTAIHLIHHLDTVRMFKDKAGSQFKVYANPQTNKIIICKDTVVKLYTQLVEDKSKPSAFDSTIFKFADTVYFETKASQPICKNKIEITLDGGISFNAIPRLDNSAQHTQTDGSHVAAEFTISQIFNNWLQAGISASYMTLSYQDDLPYPGSVAGTYNQVYLGNPIIPVQLFGKFTFGKPIGWQANLSLSVGYSIPTKGKIVNNGITLTTTPSVQGAPTAGIKLGVAYFFTCKFGLGISAAGQYFANKGALRNYNLFALPITGGLRIRF
ncbi:MAG: hypothetical protein JST75_02415 [Bacteroidetes bacterium]|nr:hypothetical protein [Bacteroidota bacterium]